MKSAKLAALGAVVVGAACLMTPVGAISAEQRTLISQNCTAIKVSLEKLQRSDSRTRTYLGTTYETLSNRFIIPLNLRLVNNGRPTFGNIQADFTLAHFEFRSRYTSYMREFDALMNINCDTRPDDFYAQLERVRERRSELKTTTDKLQTLADQQYTAALKLRVSL